MGDLKMTLKVIDGLTLLDLVTKINADATIESVLSIQGSSAVVKVFDPIAPSSGKSFSEVSKTAPDGSTETVKTETDKDGASTTTTERKDAKGVTTKDTVKKDKDGNVIP